MAPRARKDAPVDLDGLCGTVGERARRLGHRLGAWEDPGGQDAVERRAACAICGAVAYVRIEGGLAGASGGACTEPCPGGRGASGVRPTTGR